MFGSDSVSAWYFPTYCFDFEWLPQSWKLFHTYIEYFKGSFQNIFKYQVWVDYLILYFLSIEMKLILWGVHSSHFIHHLVSCLLRTFTERETCKGPIIIDNLEYTFKQILSKVRFKSSQSILNWRIFRNVSVLMSLVGRMKLLEYRCCNVSHFGINY